jgi:protein phosphatase
MDLSDGSLLAVADGLGGHAAGDIASEQAVNSLRSFFDTVEIDDPRETLAAGISKANDAVRTADPNRDTSNMGTTLVVALVVDGQATIANVGDSRAYQVTEEQIEQITVDQSLVRELVEQGTISEDEMDEHPQRHVLTQALGTSDSVDPDIYNLTLSGILLLCSDGLYEEVSESTMHDVVSAADSLKQSADELIREANQNGGSDNISVGLGRESSFCE